MSLMLSLLVGIVSGAGLVVLAIILVTKYSRKQDRFEKRKTSHVTEVLQVDMVDRRLRSTSLDHSVDMDMVSVTRPGHIRADDILQPVSPLVTKIE